MEDRARSWWWKSGSLVRQAEAPPSSTYDRVPQVSAYARRERRRAGTQKKKR